MTRLNRRTGAMAIVAVLFGMMAGSASAQTVVTVCGRDDAPGGTNLKAALAVGGAVVIRCGPAPQAIQVTQTHALVQDTAIDGEGRVTLAGDGSRPLFTTSRALALSNLTVRNRQTGGAAASAAVVVGGRVDLVGVRTENTIGPYAVVTFNATDSVFEANGDAAGESFRAVVEAETITLRRSTFTNNADHPIGGGANPAAGHTPGSRSIVIEDSTFSGNRFPLLVLDASLVVRRSTFTNNGTRQADTARVWGCCAGAITMVHSIAAIDDSTFSGNASSGFGGAVSAIASRLNIRRTLFENNTARVGGAVMFWGRAAVTNIWSTGPLPGPLSLTLERVRFRSNVASETGGALTWSGNVDGDSAIFADNRARRGGAVAHWTSGALDADFADVFAGLSGLTQPGTETLALSRGVFVDNIATQEGGALDGGVAVVSLGNALVARNHVDTAGGVSALHGAELRLTNATVVGNRSAGVTLSGAPRGLTLSNSVVANNDRGNCNAASGTLTADATNIQFPGGSCGAAARSIAPSLDAEYSPSLTSPARYTGNVSNCLGDPLVGGRDLHGRPRGNKGTCAVGAIEPEINRDLFSNTPFARSAYPWRWVHLLLLFWIFVGIIVGFKRVRAHKVRRQQLATS